jgi:hypothetical protein
MFGSRVYTFWISCSQRFYIIQFSNHLTLSDVNDEGYSRNVTDEGYSRNVTDEHESQTSAYAINMRAKHQLML